MPFAGYLVYLGRFNLFLVATAGAVGCNLGSVIAYWIGAKGGRPLVERYGKWVLMSHHDLDRMTSSFEKYGSIAILLGRMLPVVQTFIAFPAGIAQNAAAALSHLHFRRFLALVLLPGLGRHEAGRERGTPIRALSRHFTAFISPWSWRWSRHSSGSCGRTSIADDEAAKRDDARAGKVRQLAESTLLRL